MIATCCSEARGARHISRFAADALKSAGTVLPGAIAILLPKCPICVAAWIAAGTGVAIPTTVATGIRPSLVVACLLLALLLCRRALGRSRFV